MTSSSKNNELKDDLDPNYADGTAAVVRAISGFIPVAGNSISELILPHIANLWQVRATNYIRCLAEKINDIPIDKLNAIIASQHTLSIIEEGFLKSMQIYSSIRIEQLACLTSSTLQEKEINEEISILLIRTLCEINDSEVILLKSRHQKCDASFLALHATTINAGKVNSASNDSERYNAELYDRYISHLVQLGLLAPVYADMNASPKFNLTELQETLEHRITKLGNKLIEYIGIA